MPILGVARLPDEAGCTIPFGIFAIATIAVSVLGNGTMVYSII